ncbi:MAG: PIN/TRAM domain-containing protein [Vicinamibacterales bacterium]
MHWLPVVRLLFVSVVGYSAHQLEPLAHTAANLLLGVSIGAAIVLAEHRLRDISITSLLGALIGGAIGLGLAKTIGTALYWADLGSPRVVFLHSVILLTLPYIGLVVGSRRSEWLQPERLAGLIRGGPSVRRYRVLDTSAIIDGRIADVCETGFLDGTVVVPQFVLKELQAVADSTDAMRRNRGRRGLDVLQRMQKAPGVDILISDMEFPDVREVDLKLIELALALEGQLVTNDFNLNKVAQLRGIRVLNVNDLANALKPAVLTGEVLRVHVLKEGKEAGQGVAYLDDGTMVVVDHGRRLLGRTVDVSVTSVLQTAAGKMIFARLREPGAAPSPGEREDPRRVRAVPDAATAP